MWRYIFEVGQRVYVCVFLFVIEEREVENGELEKERKEEHEKKINFFDKKFGAKYFEIFRFPFWSILRNPIKKKLQNEISKKKKIDKKKFFAKII